MHPPPRDPSPPEETTEVHYSAHSAATDGEPVLASDSRLLSIKAFGPYRVLRVLAKGGMGAVFEVEHRQLQARYALKTILGSPSSDGFQLQLARFKREAELNARLDHPAILTVHSASLEGEIPYLVIDLLGGGSLGERLDRETRLPVEETISLALTLARGLRHAHERGVLHRDLKPDNVMFDDHGQPCLVDFGLALEVGRESRLTRSGTAVGTPLTMAPEQIKGEREETSATDVYGFAATIYWVLSGDAPLGSSFTGLPDLMIAILHRDPPPIRDAVPEVPRALADLLQRSLRKDPAERPDFEEWIRTLELLQQGSGSGSALERVAARATPKQKLGLLLGAAGLLLAATLALTLALLPEPLPPPSPSPSEHARPTQSAPPDWQALAIAGETSSARRALLRAGPALDADEAELACALLARGPTASLFAEGGETSSLDAFGPRLDALDEETRAALWGLACLAQNEPLRARQHARRESLARELIELEAQRARIDAEEVIPRLSRLSLEATVREADRHYEDLIGATKTWTPQRLESLRPPTRALATVALDRLQWTVARLGFVLLQSGRVHGSGMEPVGRAVRLAARIPRQPGLGRVTLDLFFSVDQNSGHYPEHYTLLEQLAAFQPELLADPGGRALYGALAVRYERDPVEAVRLARIAFDQTQPLGDLSRHAHWILPRMVCRQIEIEYLGLEAGEAGVNLGEMEKLLHGIPAAKHRDLYAASVCGYLFRRELEEAERRLRLAEAEEYEDYDYRASLRLLRAELTLAKDPAGAAGEVLKLLSPPTGDFLEEFGLRAHAKVLAGLDPAEDLAEFARRKAKGWRRLGVPWHGFELGPLFDGKAWWPGVPR